MNPKFLLPLFLLLACISCKKHTSDSVPAGKTSYLIGTWNWVSTTTAWSNLIESPATTGKHMTYTFRDDSTLLITTDTGTSYTPYHIFADTAFTRGYTTEFMSLGTPGGSQYVVSFVHDTLLLSAGYVDGNDYVFVKE